MHLRLLSLALALLLGGAPLGAAAAETYELHAILPLTGGAAFLGKEEADAMHVIEGVVNKSGGIRGQTLKFVIDDDQTNPQVTVQLTNALLARKVPLFLGSSLAATCGPQLPLVKDGPLQYCLSPSVHPAAGGYTFSANYATDDIFAVAMRYFRERGLRRIAVLNGTDATGIDADHMIDGLVKAPENKAISVVAYEHYNLTDITVSAQIARIKAANPQALIVYTTGTPMATVLRGLQESGLDIPILTSAGNMIYPQMDAYKPFMPKELLFIGPPVFGVDAVTDRAMKKQIGDFYVAFRAAGFRPDQIHAFMWDVVGLVVDAIRTVGPNATAAQYRDKLAGTRDWTGVFGKYDFRAVPQRGLGPAWMTVERWDIPRDTWVAVSRPGGGPLK